MRKRTAMLASTGCGGCEDELGTTDDELSPDTFECEEYEVGDTSDVITGTWAMPNDKPIVSFTVPTDPGGGYVELELTSPNTGIIPGFIVKPEGDEGGAIISASAAGTADTATMRGLFAVEPGQKYNVTATQFQNAPSADYPVEFELNWAFTGTMDCFESNDTVDEAKQVPVGTQIEAFAMAGYEENSLTTIPYDDYYKIVVNRSATVEAELVTPPGDHRMRIRFWDEGRTRQLAGEGASMGGEKFTTTYTFPSAGTYIMSVEVAEASAASLNGDSASSIPGHFTTPYLVDLREAQ